ncbi:MAG: hypothetical protein AAF609_22705 [Cyanobacteria bacterium P01_C01_bin.120]
MNQPLSQSPVKALELAIKLAHSGDSHEQAHAAFNEALDAVRSHDPQTAAMLQMLWREYVTTQRSATFWQELCQVEKHLSERITESHMQLRQNYQRLMQEQ